MSVCITSTVGSALIFNFMNNLNLIFCSCIWYFFHIHIICNHIHEKYVYFHGNTDNSHRTETHLFRYAHTLTHSCTHITTRLGGFCKVAHKLDQKTLTANHDDMLCSQHTVLQQVPQHHV